MFSGFAQKYTVFVHENEYLQILQINFYAFKIALNVSISLLVVIFVLYGVFLCPDVKIIA